MNLKNITIKDFKKLRNFTTEFSNGLNVIVGPNAIGKSTLTYAIAFALYGTKAIKGKGEDIPTWGEKSSEVSLTLGDFTIVRTLKNCKVLGVSGETLAVGNSVCSKYISQHITGLNLDKFKTLNWSEQGETAALLTLGEMKLQRDLEELTKIDYVDKALKAIKVDLSSNQAVLESVGEIDSTVTVESVDKLNREVSTLNRKGKSLHNLIEETTTSYNLLSTGLETAKANKAKFLKYEKELHNLALEKASLETSLKEKKEVLASLQFVDNLEEVGRKLEDITQEVFLLKKLESEGLAHEKSLKEVKENIKLAIYYLASEEGCVEDYTLAVAVKTEAYNKKEDITKKVKAIQNLITELTDDIDSGVCSKCNSILVEGDKLEGMRNQLSIAETKIKDLKKSKISIDSHLGVASENEESLRSLKLDYENNKKELDTLRLKLESLNLITIGKVPTGKIKSLEDSKLPLLFAISSQEISLNEKVKLDKQISNLNKELANVLGRSQAVNLLSKDLKTTPENLEEISENLADLLVSINESKNKKLEVSYEVSSMEKEIKTLNEKLKEKTEYEKVKSKIGLLKELHGLVYSSRTLFLTDLWNGILNEASNFLSVSSNGLVGGVIKKDKVGFMFLENGVYSPITSASGAQKSFIGVAIRLALSRYLDTGVSFNILDEPTDSMSEDNSMSLASALVSEGQTLLVTHREFDSIAAENIITIS